MTDIQIYTDGSCLGNPGPGGWGVLIIGPNKEIELSGNERDTTNNRMEMQAIIQALSWLKNNLTQSQLEAINIELFSDSNLIIQTINKGWKKKANTDLWAEIDRLRAWLNIKWTWVKAHHTNERNNQVDELARNAAKLV